MESIKVRGKYKVQLVKLSGPGEVKTSDKSTNFSQAPRVDQTRTVGVSYKFDGKVRKKWASFKWLSVMKVRLLRRRSLEFI